MATVTKRSIHFDGMAWPRAQEPEDDSVQWRLRYGTPSREDILYAASVMSAYTALINKNERARRKVIRELRAAEGRRR